MNKKTSREDVVVNSMQEKDARQVGGNTEAVESDQDLTTQLEKLLSEDGMLPVDPKDAILGTALLAKVRKRIKGEFSDNSIKNYFSSFSKNPESPIAKKSTGYGYFRRPKLDVTISEISVGINEEAVSLVPLPNPVVESNAGREEQLEEKFRALYMKWEEAEQHFPAYIEHTKSTKAARGTHKWKFPDVVVLSWEVLVVTERGFELDEPLLGIKNGLGDRPFGISSVELKVDIGFHNMRQYFFQCVSNSKWANDAHLVIATDIDDEQLEDELRRLGSSFNVSITTFGLSVQELEALDNASELSVLSEDNVAPYFSKIRKIFSARSSNSLDWEHVKDLRAINSDFNGVFGWISRCLQDKNPYTHKDYFELKRKETRELEVQLARAKAGR